MLQYYLSFWRQNRRILLEGKLRLSDPQGYYSKASSLLGQEEITVVYTDVTVEKAAPKTTVVNCGPARTLYLDGFDGARYCMVDCMGNEVETGFFKGCPPCPYPTPVRYLSK